MTTDHDLLARINYEIGLAETTGNTTDTSFLYALRAVVELHKPEQTNHPTWTEQVYGCGHCSDCGWQPYPCPTIQAIEKELG